MNLFKMWQHPNLGNNSNLKKIKIYSIRFQQQFQQNLKPLIQSLNPNAKIPEPANTGQNRPGQMVLLISPTSISSPGFKQIRPQNRRSIGLQDMQGLGFRVGAFSESCTCAGGRVGQNERWSVGGRTGPRHSSCCHGF